MEKKYKKGIIIGILIIIIVIGAIYGILNAKNVDNFSSQHNAIDTKDGNNKPGDFTGTYTWSKNYTNESGNKIKLNITLVLNKDGSATYDASDGYSYEATKGTYKIENYKVIYTREYYNYPNQNSTKYDDANNKTETFNIIDSNTLQNTYNNQTTELKK